MRSTAVTAPAGTLVSIRVFGIDLDFDAISRELAMPPSESHRKGEHGITSRVYEEDMWSIDSPYPSTAPLQVHLGWLRKALLPHYEFLRSLGAKYELSSYCGISINGDNCEVHLSPEDLAIFADLDIAMNLSLVFASYSNLDRQRAETRIYIKGASVSLEVTGMGLDLKGVSTGLGLESSQTHRAGDLDASGKVYATDVWSLTVPLPRTHELDAHLRWLGSALLPHSDVLRALRPKAGLLVRCDFVTQSDTGGVSISPEGLTLCTEVGMPMEFNAFLIL